MLNEVVGSNTDETSRLMENSFFQSSSKWSLFSNQGRIRQRKERDGLRLSYAVPKIQLAFNPHCPYGQSSSLHFQIEYWI